MNWDDFRDWVNKKYSKTWARNVFCYVKKYYGMLNGNLREIETFSKSKKNNVLKSLIAFAKYLGCYELFKSRISNHGIKWEIQNSFETFLRIRNTKEDLMEWVNTCLNVLDEHERTFIKFLKISGLRTGEAINSFNLIVKLSKEGRLHEYYSSELEIFEHFKFGEIFIRGSKNVFFSFIPRGLVEQIAGCRSASYSSLRKHLRKQGLKTRFNELRDYYATFMIHHGLIKEEVDILQGRVGKSIFMKHYFSPSLKNLKDRTLKAVNELDRSIIC